MDGSPKSPPFSLGVEEEFAIVNARTGALAQAYDILMQRAPAEAREHMKPEFLRSFVECITSVCPDVAAVDRETRRWRATASALARQAGLAIIAAGTHPYERWWDQVRTADARYAALEDRLQDVARSILIYGLHVHVNIDDLALRIAVMNQARNFLPQILALSANSPYWMGRATGYHSYRIAVWSSFPMSGIPPVFPDVAAYEDYIKLMQGVGALDSVRRVWWDVRAHEKLPTLEYRIADMPIRHADTMAIVAFIQALTKMLVERTQAGQMLTPLPTEIVLENRFRAGMYGLRGTQIDLTNRCAIPTTAAIAATLDMIAPTAAGLGLASYMSYLRRMLSPSYHSGAERQLAAAAQADARDTTRHAVVDLLMRETLVGINPSDALPPLDFPPPDKVK
jgi:glutamate---cysteine ligase / carboxylate-amine ligase